MRDARDSDRKFKVLRMLILPASLAMVITALSLPSRASTITFNPQGNGAGAGAITGVSGFSYATSSALALGIGSPGTPGNPNTTPFNVYYESVINATNGTPSTIGANYSINGSANQFTVIAGFTEHISSFDAAGTLTFALNSAPGVSTSTAAPNFFEILANPVGSGVNPNTGNGANFGSGTPILVGYLTQLNFGGSFSVSLSGGNPAVGQFNQSGLATTITTANTLVGGGGTQIGVVVTSFNPNYFPTNPGTLIFSTTNSLPFASVAPLSGFYSGPNATPNINYPGSPSSGFDTGTINAVNGNSLMFQSIATSSFNAIPEPSSIVMAATAGLGIPMVLSLRRRLARKSIA